MSVHLHVYVYTLIQLYIVLTVSEIVIMVCQALTTCLQKAKLPF